MPNTDGPGQLPPPQTLPYDLMTNPPPPTLWLVANALPADGLTILAGRSQYRRNLRGGPPLTALKERLGPLQHAALNLVLSLATGYPWFGQPVLIQRRVLWISSRTREEASRLLFEAAQAAGVDYFGGIAVLSTSDKWGEPDLRQFDVVVIDDILRRDPNETEIASSNPRIAAAIGTARRSGLSVIRTLLDDRDKPPFRWLLSADGCPRRTALQVTDDGGLWLVRDPERPPGRIWPSIFP